MKKNRSYQPHGFTLTELLTVVVIIGILVSIPVGRFLRARDRAFVATAIGDVDQFRKALAIYEADYGSYPQTDFGGVPPFTIALVDRDGVPYMSLPNGDNFTTFTYSAIDNGQSYQIDVTANDNSNTPVRADPAGTLIQN